MITVSDEAQPKKDEEEKEEEGEDKKKKEMDEEEKRKLSSAFLPVMGALQVSNYFLGLPWRGAVWGRPEGKLGPTERDMEIIYISWLKPDILKPKYHNRGLKCCDVSELQVIYIHEA